MKYVDYDKTTGAIKGYYDKEIHGDNIPLECISVTDAVWEELIKGSNKYSVDLTKTFTEEIDSIESGFTYDAGEPVLEEVIIQIPEKEVFNMKAEIESLKATIDTLIIASLEG